VPKLGVLVEDAASAATVGQLARVQAEGGVRLNTNLLRLTVLKQNRSWILESKSMM
jgi:hypothetical protein